MHLQVALASVFLSTLITCSPGPAAKTLPCDYSGRGGLPATFTRNIVAGMKSETKGGSCSPDGTCFWDGVAPFCPERPCPGGYDECGRDQCGDSECCWTGHKSCCCKIEE